MSAACPSRSLQCPFFQDFGRALNEFRGGHMSSSLPRRLTDLNDRMRDKKWLPLTAQNVGPAVCWLQVAPAWHPVHLKTKYQSLSLSLLAPTNEHNNRSNELRGTSIILTPPLTNPPFCPTLIHFGGNQQRTAENNNNIFLYRLSMMRRNVIINLFNPFKSSRKAGGRSSSTRSLGVPRRSSSGRAKRK
jgi:hypothetical protein